MSGGHPYHVKHKALTSTLTLEEHAEFAAIARSVGLKPTAFATAILRRYLEQRRKDVVAHFSEAAE